MKKPVHFHFPSFQAGVLVGVIIAFSLAAFAIRNSGLSLQKQPDADSMLTRGFNFRKLHDANYSWRGPNLGEKINLSQLKNSDGQSIAEIAKTRNIMLVTLDHECGMCSVSGDLINSVREGLKPVEIEYYPVSFARFDSAENIEQYSISLGFQSKTFTWTKEGEPPQQSLQNIVTPSHLLLDKTGKVLKVWAGSSQEKANREIMSRQIIADTNIVNDTQAAILEQK